MTDVFSIPPEPKFDEEHWFEGRRLYLEGCAACHGESGEPDPSTELQQDSDGYPVSPRSFVRGVFKGGSDGPALYARIFKGMAATPMPASEGNFTGEQFWHIVHYIQSLAQAGSQERAWLRRATITAKAVAPGALPAEPVAPEWNAAPPTYVSEPEREERGSDGRNKQTGAHPPPEMGPDAAGNATRKHETPER